MAGASLVEARAADLRAGLSERLHALCGTAGAEVVSPAPSLRLPSSRPPPGLQRHSSPLSLDAPLTRTSHAYFGTGMRLGDSAAADAPSPGVACRLPPPLPFANGSAAAGGDGQQPRKELVRSSGCSSAPSLEWRWRLRESGAWRSWWRCASALKSSALGGEGSGGGSCEGDGMPDGRDAAGGWEGCWPGRVGGAGCCGCCRGGCTHVPAACGS